MTKLERMSKSSTRGLFLLLVFACIAVVLVIPANAYASNAVNAKSFSFEETSIIEFKNIGNQDVNSLRIWLGQDVNFKSFKTENGWMGQKTPQGVIIFTSSQSIKPNESIKIGIKTDKNNPSINWKALDKNETQIEIGNTVSKKLPSPVINQKITDENSSEGILSYSSFKIIPEQLTAGSTIRVIGDNFGAHHEFDFYINEQKIGVFKSNQGGHFIGTTAIPQNQNPDRVDFYLKDNAGNEKKLSLRISEIKNKLPVTENIKLTIKGAPEKLDRGSILPISGTSQPNGVVTISIKDMNEKIINSRIAKVDSKGNWELKELLIIPMDSTYGRYSTVISDGREEISTSWILESSKTILLNPSSVRFDAGETIIFNGTALPNQSIELILYDPLGNEKSSDIIQVDESGIIEFTYLTKKNVDKEGTWTLRANQNGNKILVFVGLNVNPSIPINIDSDKLNYKSTETAMISLTGLSSDKINLTIIDPSDKPIKFLDDKDSISIKLQKDGKKSYPLELSGYASGVYTAIISKGASKSSTIFTVGLQMGSGDIKMNSIKSEYRPGEPILILGETNPNSLITITLSDPNGSTWKTLETFSDKNGKISNNELRLPSKAKIGTWNINTKSGSNYNDIKIESISTIEQGLTVTVKQTVSGNIGKIIEFKIINAIQSVKIEIVDSGGVVIQTLTSVASNNGDVITPWIVPKDIVFGTYTVKVTDAKNMAETTFDLK